MDVRGAAAIPLGLQGRIIGAIVLAFVVVAVKLFTDAGIGTKVTG